MTSEILNIRSQCNSNSIMCVGGSKSNDLLLRLVACSNCLNVTKQTLLNQPQFNGAAFWYFTPNKSFGFSPTNKIRQNIADDNDEASNLRLSWHLDVNDGGWRLGNLVRLNNDTIYFKKFFLK